MEIKDTLPLFSLKDQHGTTVHSDSFLGKPVLIYFYPKNFTPGCTAEACGFRDAYEAFSDKGIRVVGISSDSEKSHQKFANRYKLPFTLLSDSKKKIQRLFGVSSSLLGILPGRETFLFDDKGLLVFKFKSLSGTAHVKEALKKLKHV